MKFKVEYETIGTIENYGKMAEITTDICKNHENRGKITASIHTPERDVFSQPSIYIYTVGYMPWAWRLSSVTFRCCLKTIPHIIILSSRHESDIPSLKFAIWTPSFIILVWGHHPPLRRTVFACLQNCYNSCISCRLAAEARYVMTLLI